MELIGIEPTTSSMPSATRRSEGSAEERKTVDFTGICSPAFAGVPGHLAPLLAPLGRRPSERDRGRVAAWSSIYTDPVSIVPHSEEPTSLVVIAPDEALLRARPLPSDDEMAIEGLTDDEWTAFETALAER